jgi:hypothetical protein
MAEQFVKSQITYEKFLECLNKKSNQTWELSKEYANEFEDEKENISILNSVNLITPENIHINSFMYEPILDMGDGDLRKLYKKVKRELKIQ